MKIQSRIQNFSSEKKPKSQAPLSIIDRALMNRAVTKNELQLPNKQTVSINSYILKREEVMKRFGLNNDNLQEKDYKLNKPSKYRDAQKYFDSLSSNEKLCILLDFSIMANPHSQTTQLWFNKDIKAFTFNPMRPVNGRTEIRHTDADSFMYYSLFDSKDKSLQSKIIFKDNDTFIEAKVPTIDKMHDMWFKSLTFEIKVGMASMLNSLDKQNYPFSKVLLNSLTHAI